MQAGYWLWAWRSLGLVTAIALLAIPAAGQTPAGQTPAPFKAGITAPTVNMLPLWLARDEGLFRAHGLAVEIVVTDGGSRGLAEVGAGRLDEMTVGLSSVLDANSRGGNYRLVASGANTLSLGFYGAPGVASAAQLKGRKVGISARGSESDTAAMFALRRLGLTRQDVTIVELGGTEKRLEALKGGVVDASALNAPVNFMAERDRLPNLVDLANDVPWIFTGLVFGRDTIVKNRETVKNFLRGYVEGITFALSNEAKAKAVLAREFKGLDAGIVEATYDDFKRRVPRDAAPSRAGAEDMIRELPAFGVAVKSTNVADYIDASLIEELKREGFFDAMKKTYGVE
jgi:ABC-type nitrate/sulfonate/bicarbonate transport system substrate-binding protein